MFSVSFELKSLNKRKRDVNRTLCYAGTKSLRLSAFYEGIEPPVKSFALSRLTLSPFVRAHKSVQRHLISRGTAVLTFSKSHGGVCS